MSCVPTTHTYVAVFPPPSVMRLSSISEIAFVKVRPYSEIYCKVTRNFLASVLLSLGCGEFFRGVGGTAAGPVPKRILSDIPDLQPPVTMRNVSRHGGEGEALCCKDRDRRTEK